MVPAFSLTAAQPGDGRFGHCEDLLAWFILDLSLPITGICDLICAQGESPTVQILQGSFRINRNIIQIQDRVLRRFYAESTAVSCLITDRSLCCSVPLAGGIYTV